ncbi:TPA: 30S ribosomal protein S17 [Candidatus Komeilibacteria bacterium]|nr:MAG: 30S ribosomal protein S17 [Parcubacteria group bacterium GW2011_GWC2_45_15]OGY93341.1 MAG: 30S ribosomal protein S17 [Candidatus Komeilibacteria bacterium RIFOXYC2_FULL_45_12]OGY94926.1 MAG: 30S ribosomal protein S17 [Candidatus Komeilibacteria bacterium RIFOXYA2_FULL_45_9]HAH03953.1 30S ribosomal protein S17 [Candidatus Komeilibacteria bacterium]HBR13513.1 30S ribosomal protein S17 [Candidatus Komeilibacteria bacterium]
MTEAKTTTGPRNIFRKMEGVIVSDKMDKTVVVRVDRQVLNKKYQKRFTVSRKYKCHDAKNEYKTGAKVVIAECRPISKDKKWRVIGLAKGKK